MTTWKTLLAAAVLAAAPTMGFAYECNWGKAEQTTMSCAPGTAWDADTRTCVTSVSS